ncbi:hypothetical protein [Kribbella ginsengisoli]|uniref:hypothetical protein n=1 Tax=Kribbella ginsengisoli TaxID=363865 RepID=UPI0031D99D3B
MTAYISRLPSNGGAISTGTASTSWLRRSSQSAQSAAAIAMGIRPWIRPTASVAVVEMMIVYV